MIWQSEISAVALFVKIDPSSVADSISQRAAKFCVIPELFVMPTPLMVNVKMGLTVMVNALAPEVNTMPLTSVSPRAKRSLCWRDPKVACPFGRWDGRRPISGGVPESLVTVRFQVALPAKAVLAAEKQQRPEDRWQWNTALRGAGVKE